ncbi:PDZ domain-containing protein [Ferruginibacter sp. HRS2-29]|uniref:PDZ domain-containing protein n=1 Tax=Ferruginibacter sp. HRS2-29 TaxID=2487334 RepID=UPI0020CB94E5|nr:PDZ domain-containing protein [Ferruginibacter sp. HRS2-29]MCP9752862.1 PDZ domain-containing protein [Ferruginibacter sp. HRS2-29]
MKKLISAAIFPWLMTIFGQKAMAQDTPKVTDEKKETQEIIIRKKGDKDVTLNLQITGDKVTVNGKPLIEFSDDAITINKKKIVIRDNFDINFDGVNLDDFIHDNDITVSGFGSKRSGAFLGVYTDKTDDGAKISNITKESAAEAAGLKKDDIITKINDTKVTGPEDLSEAISNFKPKDEIKVTYKRGSDKEKTVKATLKEREISETRSFSFTSPDGGARSFSFPRTPTPPRTPGAAWGDDGRSFNDLIVVGKSRQKLGIKIQDTEESNGVKILDVDDDSPASKAGIKKDDVLTELNGKKITNTDEARQLLQENAENNSYPVKVKRNGTEMTLNVKIPKKLKTTTL